MKSLGLRFLCAIKRNKKEYKYVSHGLELASVFFTWSDCIVAGDEQNPKQTQESVIAGGGGAGERARGKEGSKGEGGGQHWRKATEKLKALS